MLYINIFIKYYGIYILACAIIMRLPAAELVSRVEILSAAFFAFLWFFEKQ
jgi:hypothetical protein